ncbi:MAG: methyltransferase domain-containing protein [Saprospiraceae bacterium]|jgi:2-polyprenyl-3-methyl-5-hydroxy-6-metoxy-1,4-benzoquinol methylase|nr:methyltransferase domain-containing protein [Saprospiraceae bacterium]
MDNYLEINRKLWNDKVAIHVDSEFYNQKDFMVGKTSLKTIELDLLGEITGKDIIHLQCHFGQDTLSMARMGANVIGIDFSEKAIEVAKNLNKELGLNAKFICSDVYETDKHVNQQFDIVFTTYGTIGWLPDLKPWAKLISKLLKPGGRLVFVEFHPVVWTLDENFDHIKYFYFNVEEIKEIEEGTYADRYVSIKNESISWNHSLTEVLQNLIDENLKITKFQEFDYSPYTCFNRLVKTGEDKYQVEGLEGKIPMVYAVEAIKLE